MSTVSDVIEIIRMNGIQKSWSILFPRLIKRAIHTAHLSVDIILFFLKILRYSLQSRKQGRRLVVISLIEHLGDIVACEPVARSVRIQEPNSLILWCVKRNYRQIIEQFPTIDYAISVYCLTSWIVIKQLIRIDRVVDLHINGRTCQICGLRLKKIEGDLNITQENYYTHGALLTIFCRSAGLPELNCQPLLNLSKVVRDKVSKYFVGKPTVVIHCNSNESCRDWAPDRWNNLIDSLNAIYGVLVIEIGVESQLNRVDSEGYLNLCGKSSILESAEIIRRSHLFIGVDSGPAHIANAVGTFGIVLLGHYLYFEYYTPYTGAYADGNGAVLMRADGDVSSIPVFAVLKVFGEHFPFLCLNLNE
jgi:ADP-heptose:LPS heptosyltransferase